MLFGRIKTYLAIAGAFVVALALAFLRGASIGAANADRKSKDELLNDVAEAQKVREDVEILDDVGLGDRASKWLRGNTDK